jgi:N-acetylmuramoyl-L-alanine amidase
VRYLVVGLLLLAAACGGSVASTPTPESSNEPAQSPFRAVMVAHQAVTPSPTPSASPIPIYHPPPYTVAIEAGHGGPGYWGASARDADGNVWIEKDLALSVALRVHDLLSETGYNTVLIRSDDSTLTWWDAANYRSSMIAETQERVRVANESGADALLSIHFNGWGDSSQHGTEGYCNPDRSFGTESCRLTWFVQQALVAGIRGAGYDIADRGIKNDGLVNGDPQNQHSFALGTNANFSPSLMPGTIAEVLFLSNPDDLAFMRRADAVDVIAQAFVEGLNQYFSWLNNH